MNKKVTEKLVSQKCVPCEGGMQAMGPLEVAKYLSQTPGWVLAKDKKEIAREFSLTDFTHAIKFVQKIARLAEKEGHHPDMLIHNWNQVRLMLSTHAIGGLSENDFIMAAKVNKLAL